MLSKFENICLNTKIQKFHINIIVSNNLSKEITFRE